MYIKDFLQISVGQSGIGVSPMFEAIEVEL